MTDREGTHRGSFPCTFKPRQSAGRRERMRFASVPNQLRTPRPSCSRGGSDHEHQDHPFRRRRPRCAGRRQRQHAGPGQGGCKASPRRRRTQAEPRGRGDQGTALGSADPDRASQRQGGARPGGPGSGPAGPGRGAGRHGPGAAGPDPGRRPDQDHSDPGADGRRRPAQAQDRLVGGDFSQRPDVLRCHQHRSEGRWGEAGPERGQLRHQALLHLGRSHLQQDLLGRHHHRLQL